jgi:glycosyltransferase involved in cell wall biosynthesis
VNRSDHADKFASSVKIHGLSVLVPIYNEINTLEIALEKLVTVTNTFDGSEIILIESNSNDGSREKIMHLKEKWSHPTKLKVILEQTPKGKGHAVRQGLSAARKDIIVLYDGDLEYLASDLIKLVEPIQNGETSFVLGSRYIKGKPMREFNKQKFLESLLNIAHYVFSLLFSLFYGIKLKDPFTMWKVFRRDAIESLIFECNRFDFDWELTAKLIRNGSIPIELPVTYNSRNFQEGKKVQIFSDPITWIVALIKFRILPKRSWKH